MCNELNPEIKIKAKQVTEDLITFMQELDTENNRQINELKKDIEYYKSRITELEKANEWHFPTKDNQFPFFGRPCLCIDFNDNIGIAYLREDGVWTTDGKNAFESIKCWQYLKLPELKESGE